MRLHIQNAALKEDDAFKDYLKEGMMKELKSLIDNLKWEDIVRREERANAIIYTIDLEFK